jgi:hypothetical protein
LGLPYDAKLDVELVALSGIGPRRFAGLKVHLNTARSWLSKSMLQCVQREVHLSRAMSDSLVRHHCKYGAFHPYLVSLLVRMNLATQLEHGLLPSHFVLRKRHESQLAQS